MPTRDFTGNGLKTATERQGEWLTDAIEILSRFTPQEVIPLLFELEEVERYVARSKFALRHEIFKVFEKQLFWNETGEPVDFADPSFEYYLNYPGGIKKFRSVLARDKLSISYLIKYHDLLINHPEFYDPKDR